MDRLSIQASEPIVQLGLKDSDRKSAVIAECLWKMWKKEREFDAKRPEESCLHYDEGATELRLGAVKNTLPDAPLNRKERE